jgi:hypothetical protein
VTGGPTDSASVIGSAIAAGVKGAAGAMDASNGLLAGLVAPLVNIAHGIGQIGGVAETIGKAFLPSNLMRAVCGGFGVSFLLIGIFFMSREARN